MSSNAYNNNVKEKQNPSPIEYSKLIHEVKNPLCIIKSTLQLIELQVPAVKENKYWHGLFKDIDFINCLLSDFNLYNKICLISLEKANLSSVLYDMCNEIEPLVIANNTVFNCKIPETEIMCNIDKDRLSEAFINLTKNALESVPKEGGEITIRLETYNGYANIIIEDNGCGISGDNVATIFTPFVTHKKEGTGLGLPIAQSILTNHYGAINLYSEENVGTIFTMSIPLAE